MRPIEIGLKVTGQSQVASAFASVTREGKAMDTALSQMARHVQNDSKATGKSIMGIEQALRTVKDEAKGAAKSLESIRNAGAGLAAISVGGIALSNSLAAVYKEGARANAQLEAMLKKRGEGGRLEEMTQWAGKLAHDAAMIDDDPIVQASAGLLGFGLNAKQVQEIMPGLIGQSRLYGQSLESVSMAFGKAFASGNAGALKRSGVTLDPKDLDALEKITDHTAKQKAMFELVKNSMRDYALSITEGMSEAEIASNRAALALDEAQTNIGKGAAGAQTAINGMAASLLTMANTSPQVQESAGALLTWGSYAGSVAGSLIGLGAQIGILVQSFGAIRNATALAALAADANAASQTASAIATAAAGNAAAVAAPKFGFLARMQALAGGGGIGGAALRMGGLIGGSALASVAGYEALRRTGVIDPEEHPGIMEASANMSDRFAHLGMHGAGIYGWDAQMERERQGDIAESRSMALLAKMRGRTGPKLGAGRALAAFSGAGLTSPTMAAAAKFAGLSGAGMPVDSGAAKPKSRGDMDAAMGIFGAFMGLGAAGRGGNGLPQDDEYYEQRGINPDAVRASLRGAGTGRGRGPINVNKDLDAYVLKESRSGDGQIELLLGFRPLRVVVTDGPGRQLSRNISALPLAPGF